MGHTASSIGRMSVLRRRPSQGKVPRRQRHGRPIAEHRCIRCNASILRPINSFVGEIADEYCASCRLATEKECTVYDRYRGIGAIPKNLREAYGL